MGLGVPNGLLLLKRSAISAFRIAHQVSKIHQVREVPQVNRVHQLNKVYQVNEGKHTHVQENRAFWIETQNCSIKIMIVDIKI